MDEVVDPAKIQADLKIHGRYERLENADCIRAYGTNYITDRRNLVLVSQNTTADHSNLFEAEFYFYTNYYPFDW